MKKIFCLILLFAFDASALRFKVVHEKIGEAQIPFVVNADQEEKFFNQKADFAEVERLAPLKIEDLKAITPNNLRQLSMEQFNQIYARLGSGPMPLGDYNGFVMQKLPIYHFIKKRALKQAMVFADFASLAKQICKKEAEDCLFEFIWKGKRFWPKDDQDQIMTKTMINFVSAGFKVSLLPDFLKSSLLERALDFTEGLIDKTSLTFFPMHTYCGISQVDTRRESIITDASFGDDFGFPSYVSLRDEVVTRKALNITEEYRMLRPGLYIGKVYTNKLFLFNVVLEKTGTAKPSETKNACLDTIKAL